MKTRTFLTKTIGILGGSLCLLAVHLQAGTLFWSDDAANVIQRAEDDGSGLTTLASGLTQPRGVGVDSANDLIYWGDDGGTNSIFRADATTGSGQTVLVTGFAPRGVALDLTNNHIYWTSSFDSIVRSDIDGTSATTIVSGRSGVRAVAVDPAGGFLYWTEDGPNQIVRSTLAGASVTTLFSTTSPNYLGLDLSTSEIYWTQQDGELIRKGAIDGSGSVLTVATVSGAATEGIGLDTTNQLIYFGNSTGSGKIQRVSYAGTGLTDIVTGLSNPHALAFVPEPSTYALIFAGGALLFVLGHRRFRVKED